jgi:hypothetical protein
MPRGRMLEEQNALIFHKCFPEHRRKANGRRSILVWDNLETDGRQGPRWVVLEDLPSGDARNKLLWWYRVN